MASSSESTLSHEEQEACYVLSDLFRDTELTDADIAYIIRTLQSLDIPIPALYNILRYDLFPILYPNLLSVAGEWAGFDRAWLLESIKHARKARVQHDGTFRGWVEHITMSFKWAVISYVFWSHWCIIRDRIQQNL